MRADMAAEIAQVLVGPGRPDLAVETWLGMLAVPAHAETVTVGGGGRFQRPLALYNQRVRRGGDILLQRDGFAAIGYPAAHFCGSWAAPVGPIPSSSPDDAAKRWRTGLPP